MKVLVTGSNGQVGSAVVEKRGWTGLDLEDADIEQDITDKTGLRKEVEELNPDAIVHTAAFTDLDAAEKNPGRARQINVQGTKNLIEAAESCDAHLVFISTDYVFDGERGSYSEKEEINPVSVYAKTKARAEEAVRSSDSPTTVFRPSVIFKESRDNFFTWAKSELEENGEVGAITDQMCCPTYAPNLADFIIEVVEKDILGTYHVTGDSKVTRYESVQIMKDELGLDGEVKKSKMDDLPWKAQRPRDSSLSMAKAKQDFDTKPISMSEAFSRMYG